MKKRYFAWWVTIMCCTLIFYLTYSLFFADIASASPIKIDALTKVGTFSLRNYPVADKYKALQGSTIVGNSLYVSCNSTEDDGTALIMEIDLSTFKLIRSAELPLYHANNVAYNPNYNGKAVLIIPHRSADSERTNIVSMVDIKTLTILESKILRYGVANLSYDPIKHIYIGAGWPNMVVYDDQFKYIKAYPLPLDGYDIQGSGLYKNLSIQACADSSKKLGNALFLYDEGGKMVKKFSINDDKGKLELESCNSVADGEVILGFNNWESKKVSIDFYKLNLNTAS